VTGEFETLGVAAASYLASPSGRSLEDNIKIVRLFAEFYDPSDLVGSGKEKRKNCTN
jgi:hypothetical protein